MAAAEARRGAEAEDGDDAWEVRYLVITPMRRRTATTRGRQAATGPWL